MRERGSLCAELSAQCRRGEVVVVTDVASDPGKTARERGDHRSWQIAAYVIVMLVKNGACVAAFVVHSSRPRAWSGPEVELIQDVAERTWSALERARAEDVLRASEQRLKDLLSAAMAAGAAGYVLKRSAADDLVRALRSVASGGVYLDPAMAATALAPLRHGANPVGVAKLSERESEVLRQIAEGHMVKDIASKLSISTRTLETYRARAMEKLSLKTRADIVRYALQRGWLKS